MERNIDVDNPMNLWDCIHGLLNIGEIDDAFLIVEHHPELFDDLSIELEKELERKHRAQEQMKWHK